MTPCLVTKVVGIVLSPLLLLWPLSICFKIASEPINMAAEQLVNLDSGVSRSGLSCTHALEFIYVDVGEIIFEFYNGAASVGHGDCDKSAHHVHGYEHVECYAQRQAHMLVTYVGLLENSCSVAALVDA